MLFFVWFCSFAWVVVGCRLPQQLWETLERSGHNLEPIPKAGIVFKIGLILSNKLLRIISGLSISQSCCSGLNNGSIFYLRSILLEIVALFWCGIWNFNLLLCFFYSNIEVVIRKRRKVSFSCWKNISNCRIYPDYKSVKHLIWINTIS